MQKTSIFFLIVAFFLQPLALFAADKAPEYQLVKEVPNGKTLILESGQTIRLAAIQVPNLARDAREESQPLAKEAQKSLSNWALGKKVRLDTVQGRDRHGRIVAKVYNESGELAQGVQLKAGMAWVYSFSDTRALAPELLKFEHEAEKAKRGVWADSHYAVLTEDNAAQSMNEYRLVTGSVEAVADRREQIYVNFGPDWKTDFSLMVDRDDIVNFPEGWAQSLAGKNVRVRGWLFERNGPMIEITHPEQVEILP